MGKMATTYIVFALALGCLLFISSVHAEQPYAITCCSAGTNNVLFSSEEFTVIVFDAKGITISNHEDMAFDNATYHCAGTIQIENGKQIGSYFCKFMDTDGDVTVGETTVDGTERTWNFIFGTGKWKGITGGGKNWPVTRGKPVVPGTSQNCLKATGTYQLPQ